MCILENPADTQSFLLPSGGRAEAQEAYIQYDYGYIISNLSCMSVPLLRHRIETTI